MPGNKATVRLHVCCKTDLNLNLTIFLNPHKARWTCNEPHLHLPDKRQAYIDVT